MQRERGRACASVLPDRSIRVPSASPGLECDACCDSRQDRDLRLLRASASRTNQLRHRFSSMFRDIPCDSGGLGAEYGRGSKVNRRKVASPRLLQLTPGKIGKIHSHAKKRQHWSNSGKRGSRSNVWATFGAPFARLCGSHQIRQGEFEDTRRSNVTAFTLAAIAGLSKAANIARPIRVPASQRTCAKESLVTCWIRGTPSSMRGKTEGCSGDGLLLKPLASKACRTQMRKCRAKRAQAMALGPARHDFTCFPTFPESGGITCESTPKPTCRADVEFGENTMFGLGVGQMPVLRS